MPSTTFSQTNVISPKFPEESPYFSSLDYAIPDYTSQVGGAYGLDSEQHVIELQTQLEAVTNQVNNLTNQVAALTQAFINRQAILANPAYTFPDPNPT
jgi:hypothetical protein